LFGPASKYQLKKIYHWQLRRAWETLGAERQRGHEATPAHMEESDHATQTFSRFGGTGDFLSIGSHRVVGGRDGWVGAGREFRVGPVCRAYLTWVDEDVRWIIAPEERAAYVHLADNAERLEFIKQFWDRRNPTPGSAENTFKEEHYRRIAYANVHFAAGKAGWMSDRGRIYIVNGRPDSLDSHPSGGPGETKPYVVWQYGGTQMKFVDRCACGDYELETPQK
jgi:GWxTD domain-containing protein